MTGDQNKVLLGSPKTFNLSPVVQSTVFIEFPQSPLSNNPNDGGGKRIFPDKIEPSDLEDRTSVKVKAKISAAVAGVNKRELFTHYRAYFFDPSHSKKN